MPHSIIIFLIKSLKLQSGKALSLPVDNDSHVSVVLNVDVVEPKAMVEILQNDSLKVRNAL